MKKYILISLLFHLSFFLIFKANNQLGDEELNQVVPITFVATKTSPNPGSPIAAPKEVEKKEVAVPKPKKEEKKPEKKEIKSKVADKKEEKKPEEKNIEQQEVVKSENKEETKEVDVTMTTQNGEGTDSNGSNAFQGSNFMKDGDGGYIALSSAGINYTILNEVEPEYPSQAEAIGYSERVIVTVKFLVGLKGEISKIEIIKSHAKLGFDDEVKKAIKKWKFKPIYHHGENIKVYFEKDFVFNPR